MKHALTALTDARIREIARQWRDEHPEHATGGFVTVYGNVATGWKSMPDRPEDFEPGNYAVPDGASGMFLTTGGDAQNGASAWTEIFPEDTQFVAVVTYPRVEPRNLAGKCLQGPRTPQKVKRDGYGWTFDLADAWTFPSKKQAAAKCRIVERHMDWGEGVMGAETVEFFMECEQERRAANPKADRP